MLNNTSIKPKIGEASLNISVQLFYNSMDVNRVRFDLKHFAELARGLDLPISRVVRDYLQRHYLGHLRSDHLVLQGGAALRFFYGSKRLSDDVDLVYIDERAVEDAIRAAEEISSRYSIKRAEGLTRIKAYFPYDRGEITLRIELFKIPAYTPQKLMLMGTQNKILVESPVEIKADKIVAILDLFKRRLYINMVDLYDLCYLEDLTEELDVRMVRRKLEDYAIRLTNRDFLDFLAALKKSSYRFEPTLSRYLPRDERGKIDENTMLNKITKLLIEVKEALGYE